VNAGAAIPSAAPAADREAITYYDPAENREADQVPLRLDLIRRIFSYTRLTPQSGTGFLY